MFKYKKIFYIYVLLLCASKNSYLSFIYVKIKLKIKF